MLGNLVVIAVVVAVAPRVRSPEEVAASSAPPPPSTITATVEQRVLVDEVVARGRLEPAGTTEVAAPAADGSVVVTAAPPAVGTTVDEGDRVAEVTGRPLFVLRGPIPSYRDLAPGAEGADVRQLQAALVRLGHLRTRITGTFDEATQVAVRRMYDEASVSPVVGEGAGGAQMVTLPAAEVTYVGSLPSTVHEAAALGADLGEGDEPLLVLAVGQMVVRADLPEADASALAEGDRVVVTDELAGATYDGRIAEVGMVQSAAESGVLQQPVRIDLAQPPAQGIPDVRIDVQLDATEGEAFVVPSAAVASDAGGASTVLVHGSDGDRPVEVEALVSADGFVAVRPIDADALRPGDEVVLGR